MLECGIDGAWVEKARDEQDLQREMSVYRIRALQRRTCIYVQRGICIRCAGLASAAVAVRRLNAKKSRSRTLGQLL